jgi:hypothetical protein
MPPGEPAAVELLQEFATFDLDDCLDVGVDSLDHLRGVFLSVGRDRTRMREKLVP